MNGDGFEDILVGSFSGVPQWIERTKDGFGESGAVVDKNGDFVVIGDFWNFETEEWDETDRAKSKGHCSSVAAVDWDNDGDMDLLLGGYRNGQLFLRLNEGSSKEPKFAVTNQVIKVGDDVVKFAKGIGAPRVVDWNKDGLFDIVIGTIYGGVFLMENSGTKESPEFKELTTLVAPLPGDANSKSPKQVETKDGHPVAPGSSFHVEVVDYEGDGDYDLLVGGRSEWLTGPVKVPTKEDEEKVESLTVEMEEAWDEFKEYKSTAKTKAEQKELSATEEYRSLLAKYHALRSERFQLTADPVEKGDFIWLFRRR